MTASVGFADDPAFRLSAGGDAALGAVSTGTFLASRMVPTVTAPQVEEAAIGYPDRPFIAPGNDAVSTAGTVAAVGSLLMPGASVLAGDLESGRMLTYGVMYAQAFVLTTGLKDLIKARSVRWRPYTYEEGFDAAQADEDYADSFPSGHTSYAFLGATFLSTTFRAEVSHGPWRAIVPAAAYGMAVGTGALRVASGDHFLTDVIAGAALGTLVGWVVPALHRTHEDADRPGRTPDGSPILSGLAASHRGVALRFSW